MALTIFEQNTNGILQPSPAGIAPIPNLFSTQYHRTDIAYDYAIGGIPFLAGEGGRGSFNRRVYERSFSPIRKDQFDNQQVPGEQSIWGWWLRSQSNFSLGAGLQFLDTTQDASLADRYYYSEGLDMLSTPGQASLLNLTTAETGVAVFNTIQLNGVTRIGVDGVLVLDTGGKTLKFLSTGGAIVNYAIPAGIAAASVMNTLANDGSNYYLMTSVGIYKGSITDNGIAATKIWNAPAGDTFFGVLGWVKGRLVAGWNSATVGVATLANVYELVGAGPALPTPKFSHQNPDYTFTGVSETQTAILLSGHSGNTVSQIHKFALDSGGAMPTLTSGTVAATMPVGEKILSMYAYLGVFVGIGTNKGFRVAQADINGNLAYGPLIVQDPTGVGVKAIAGYDRFLFIGNQGNTLIPQQGWVNPPDAAVTDGIMRIDLSQLTATGGQPFCNDIMAWSTINSAFVAPTGLPVNAIANMGQSGYLAFSTGTQVYTNRTTLKQPTGFVYTPKIRFNTLEPKHFKYVYMRHANITDGSIDIYGQNPNQQLTVIAPGVTGPSILGAQTPFFINDIGNAQEWFQFKFILHRGTSDSTTSPIFNGYQLRGLPGVSRQVLIKVPFLCFDHEDDRFGVPHGDDGFAYQRIKALEALAASGNIVLFQDLNYNDACLIIVDDYKFEQQSPELAKAASSNNQDSNAHGGYILLTCRVIS